MKKSVFLALCSSTFLLSNDYLPLSEISKEKKLEYNFINIDNTLIEAEKIDTKSTYEDNIEETKPKEVEEKKQIAIKKDNLILKDEIKLKEEPKVVFQNDSEKTHVSLQNDISFIAQITYSPITTDYKKDSKTHSEKSNVLIPQAQLIVDEHKFVAEYFRTKNSFDDIKLDTSWYKLGYRYIYKNLNIGADINYLSLDDKTKEQKELFPSVEADFNHQVKSVELSYGLGVGKNSTIDYEYNYFINAGIKPSVLSNTTIIAGYKNRKIKDENYEVEYRGPYLGVKSKF